MRTQIWSNIYKKQVKNNKAWVRWNLLRWLDKIIDYQPNTETTNKLKTLNKYSQKILLKAITQIKALKFILPILFLAVPRYNINKLVQLYVHLQMIKKEGAF